MAAASRPLFSCFQLQLFFPARGKISRQLFPVFSAVALFHAQGAGQLATFSSLLLMMSLFSCERGRSASDFFLHTIDCAFSCAGNDRSATSTAAFLMRGGTVRGGVKRRRGGPFHCPTGRARPTGIRRRTPWRAPLRWRGRAFPGAGTGLSRRSGAGFPSPPRCRRRAG